MKFEELLRLVENEPVFESSLLMAGKVDPAAIRLQLDRWVKRGRIIRLRRGLYQLDRPYCKVQPHPFLLANRLKRASYVSCESALAYYGLIPENVPQVTSATTGRPERLSTPLGDFSFRHLKPAAFFAYRSLDREAAQVSLATPEKALLDQVYLNASGDSRAYLAGLRLQNLSQLDAASLKTLTARFDSPSVTKALPIILEMIENEQKEYVSL